MDEKEKIRVDLIVQSPLQQGLKLADPSSIACCFILIVQSPLQQGLKRLFQATPWGWGGAYRTKSITTRIETKPRKTK